MSPPRGIGDVDAARLCSAFEAGGDIDAITKDIVAFDQHVAKVDTNSELHPPIVRDINVPFRIDISLYGEIAWRAQLGITDLVMKFIAHRGWSAGRGENSLAAFARAARDGRISGVEFDVCLAADSDTLVVSHDPPRHVENALTLDAALSLLSPTDLELFVEVKETGLVSRVIERLVASNVAHRSVVFAFAAVARSFPWEGARPVRLGIIVMYPWNLNRAVRRYAPDVLLLGWDARAWTRVAFRAWWSIFSLEQLARRHHVPVVVGIVQRMDDLHWLSRQRLYGAVADVDRTVGRSARPD
jgi:Glycerophosphoryl diester phosphodiesterase family